MKPPLLSIIVPALQESARIGRTLDELAAYLTHNDLSEVEVLIVVAESPDGTADIARGKASLFTNFRVVDAGPRHGKGRDVRTGMMEATGQYRLFMDADLATPLHHITDVLEQIKAKKPVIVAIRDLDSSHTGLRKIVSNFGNRLVQLLLLPGISDSQCGFKAFSAEAAEELFRRQTILGWGFDMEILAIARQLNFPITTIHIKDWHDQPNGVFESAIGSATLITFVELITILWRKKTGAYRHKTYTYKPYL